MPPRAPRTPRKPIKTEPSDSEGWIEVTRGSKAKPKVPVHRAEVVVAARKSARRSSRSSLIQSLADIEAEESDDMLVATGDEELEDETIESEIDKRASSPEDGPITSATSSPIGKKVGVVLETPPTPSPKKTGIKRSAPFSPQSDDLASAEESDISLKKSAGKTPRKTAAKSSRKVSGKTPRKVSNRAPRAKKTVKSKEIMSDSDAVDTDALVDAMDVEDTDDADVASVAVTELFAKATKSSEPKTPKKKVKISHAVSDSEDEPALSSLGKKPAVTMISGKISVAGNVSARKSQKGPIEDPTDNVFLDREDVPSNKSPLKKFAKTKQLDDATAVTDTPVTRLGRTFDQHTLDTPKTKKSASTSSAATDAGSSSTVGSATVDKFLVPGRVSAEYDRVGPNPRCMLSNPRKPEHRALMDEALLHTYTEALAPPITRVAQQILIGSDELHLIMLRKALARCEVERDSPAEKRIVEIMSEPEWGPLLPNFARGKAELFKVNTGGLITRTHNNAGFDLTPRDPVATFIFGSCQSSNLTQPTTSSRGGYYIKSVSVSPVCMEWQREFSTVCNIYSKSELDITAYGSCLTIGTRPSQILGNSGAENSGSSSTSVNVVNNGDYVTMRDASSRGRNSMLRERAAKGFMWPNENINVYNAAPIFQGQNSWVALHAFDINQLERIDHWHDEIPVGSFVAVITSMSLYTPTGGVHRRTQLSLNLLGAVILALPPGPLARYFIDHPQAQSEFLSPLSKGSPSTGKNKENYLDDSPAAKSHGKGKARASKTTVKSKAPAKAEVAVKGKGKGRLVEVPSDDDEDDADPTVDDAEEADE